MEQRNRSILQLLLQPYTLDILHAIESEPKQFKDLKKYVKNDMTLSNKLSKLVSHRLIDIVPLKNRNRFTNGYVISDKGKKVVAQLEKIRLG